MKIDKDRDRFHSILGKGNCGLGPDIGTRPFAVKKLLQPLKEDVRGRDDFWSTRNIYWEKYNEPE